MSPGGLHPASLGSKFPDGHVSYHGKTHISLLQCRSIISSITSNGDHLPLFPNGAIDDTLKVKEVKLAWSKWAITQNSYQRLSHLSTGMLYKGGETPSVQVINGISDKLLVGG